MGITINPPQVGVVMQTPTQERVSKGFHLLRSAPESQVNANIGGRYALPSEFDHTKYASAYASKGNEVQAMLRSQHVQGTNLTADGWQVWKYPETSSHHEYDDQGQRKMTKEKVPNPEWTPPTKGQPDSKVPQFVEIEVPVLLKHPLAGQNHEVSSLQRDGATYVLMFRPIEIQQQVNEVYGLLSIEAMEAETNGTTILGAAPDDAGMLTANRLNKVDPHVEADRLFEANRLGESAVVDPMYRGGNRLTTNTHRVSR